MPPRNPFGDPEPGLIEALLALQSPDERDRFYAAIERGDWDIGKEDEDIVVTIGGTALIRITGFTPRPKLRLVEDVDADA
jgi:hypothetical protein